MRKMSFRIFALFTLLLMESGPHLRTANCNDDADNDDYDEEAEYDYYSSESDVWILEGQIGEKYNVKEVQEGESAQFNCTAVSAQNDRLRNFHLSWEYRESIDDSTRILSADYDDVPMTVQRGPPPKYSLMNHSYEFDGLQAHALSMLVEAARTTDSGYYICTLSPNNASNAHAEYNTAHLWYELTVAAAHNASTVASHTLTTFAHATTTTTTATKTSTSAASHAGSESQPLSAVDDNQAYSSVRTELTPYEAAVMDCCVASGLHASSCLSACAFDVRTMVQFNWHRACSWPEARTAMQCYFKASAKIQATMASRASETNTFGTRECCVQKRVSASCMHVCVGYNVFADDQNCLAEFGRMLECAFSSLDSLAAPEPPRFVRLLRVAPGRVKVRWLPPVRSEKKVLGYEVYYAVEPLATRRNSSVPIEYQRVSTRALSATLQVNDDSLLSVFLQSFNTHGFSTASEEVRLSSAQSLFDVLHSVRLSNFNQAGGEQQVVKQRILDCCASRLPPQCAALFCSADVNSSLAQAELVDHCLFALPDALACFSSARDVTHCCVQQHVTPACVSFCADRSDYSPAARPAASLFAHESCVFQLASIRDCFVQAWLSVPSPPRALRFVQLLCEPSNATCSVLLQWRAPLENARLTSWYSVQIFTTDALASSTSTRLPSVRVHSDQLQATVHGLDVGELYDFSVLAVSAFGNSAASNHVRVLTASGHRSDRLSAQPANKPTDELLTATVVSRTSESIQVAWNHWSQNAELPMNSSNRSQSSNSSSADSGRYYAVSCRRLFPKSVDKQNESVTNVIIQWGAEKTFVLHELLSAAEYEVTIKAFDTSLSAEPLAQAVLTEWTTLPSAHQADSPNYVRPDSVRDALQRVNNINSSNAYTANSTARLSKCCAQPRTANADCLRLLCDESAMRNVTRFDSVVSACSFAELAKTFACLSGGSDHSLCCQMNYLPGRCMELCRGEVATAEADSDLLVPLCVPHLARVQSCFLDERYGNAPRRPLIVESHALNESAVFLAWNRRSAQRTDNARDPPIKYVVYYKKANESFDNTHAQNANASADYAVVWPLQPGTMYNLYVVAVSQHGASLPSTLVSVETYEANETFVHIIQSPRTAMNIHAEGSSLALRCVTPSLYAHTLTWYRNSNRVRNVSPRVFQAGQFNETLVFTAVMRNDVGRYTCAVRDGSTTYLSQPTYVNVQYEPMATVFDSVVDSALFDTKDLTCLFSGSPTSVRWFRTDSRQMISVGQTVREAAGRYAVQTTQYPSDPMTHSTLTIYGVLFPDYGSYTCVGANQFGYANGSVELRPDFRRETRVAAAVPLQQCCAVAAAPSCSPFCSYSLEQHANLTVRSLRSCVNEAGWPQAAAHWSCLVAGRDHRPCCMQMRLPDECSQLCAGAPLSNDDSLFRCFGYRADMLRCFKEGLATIPAQPTSLTLTQLFDNNTRILRVIASWKSLVQDCPVTRLYRVDVLNVTSNRQVSSEEVATYRNCSNHTAVLTDSYEMQLFAGGSHTYALTVTATGPFGSSLPTEPQFISLGDYVSSTRQTSQTTTASDLGSDLAAAQFTSTYMHIDDHEAVIFAACVLLLLISALMVTVLVLLYRNGLQGVHDAWRRTRHTLRRVGQSIHDRFPAGECSITARFTNEAADSTAGSTVNIPLDYSNMDYLMSNEGVPQA